MQQQTQSITALVGHILSFLGGCLTFAAGQKYFSLNVIQDFKIYLLDRKYQKAIKKEDQEKVKELQLLLPILKLYSSKKVYQGTAIGQIAQFPDDDTSFMTLASRLSSKPELSEEIKTLLLIELKKIATNLRSN